jgi:hypothetical protein
MFHRAKNWLADRKVSFVSWQDRSFRMIPGPLRLGTMIAIVGLPFYWLYTFSGPYRWLAEWQLRKWQWYYPNGTLMWLILCLSLSVMTPLQVLAARGFFERRKQGVQQIHAATTWTVFFPAFSIGLLSFGSAFTGVGIYLFFQHRGAGQNSNFDVRQLEQDQSPASQLVTLRGRLLEGRSVTVVKNHIHRVTYIPIVSDHWKHGQPVTGFVSLAPAKKLAQDGDHVVATGFLERNGLPGDARSALERSGSRLSDVHYLLHHGRDPAKMATTSGELFLLGIAILLATGLYIVAYNYRYVWRSE